MEKKYAFFFAILIVLIVVINFYFIKINFSPIREKVKIARVIDGDTFELKDGRKIRLLNINTPEKGRAGYELAIEFLKNYEGKDVEIEIKGSDKYNRILARVYGPDYLNLELVEKGFAVKFLVDNNELSRFSISEEDAIENEKGMWRKSPYFGCFDADINSVEEKVEIKNKCNKININNWILRDESRKYYVFGNLEIGKVTLHSYIGEDSKSDIFWNLKNNIWNDGRDSLYIFDKDGGIAYYESYGY